MKLCIVNDEGEVFDVTEDIEDFDLTSNFARCAVINDIIQELKMQGVKKYE